MSEDYFSAIGVTSVVRGRVDVFRRRYHELLPTVEVPNVFLSEIRDSEGSRVWQNLWLWGDNYCCEVKNFLHDEQFDGSELTHVSHWSMGLSEFEIGTTPTDKSRASLTFRFGDSLLLSGTLTASGENCAYLVNFFRSVVAPRVVLASEGE